MNENKDLTRAEFLRKLVFNRPNYTNVFIEFDTVGPLPEEEVEKEDDDELEEDEEEIQNILSPSIVHSSQSSQSLSSASSQSSSSSVIEKKLTCGNCNIRQKNVAMECRHSVCTECYESMKDDRKKECAHIRGAKRREKEEKKIKCPFSNCGKIIEHVIFLDLDV